MTLPAVTGVGHLFAVVRVMNNSAGFRFRCGVAVSCAFVIPSNCQEGAGDCAPRQNSDGTNSISNVSIAEEAGVETHR
jgi:hypothetical protein